ncbi:MAG: IclR family transcriptional regulator [Nitrososphaerales archaeon]
MDSKVIKKRGGPRDSRLELRTAKAARTETFGIRTIHVATRILVALAEYRDPVRVTDLARKLGMTMPTVSRHLSTWRELGFVDKPEGRETYRLGTKLFSLGQAAAEQNTHVSIAYPFLTELRKQVQETTVFATRSQDHAMVLLCLDSGRPTTVVVRPGTTVSLPYSPSARVLWAFGPGAEASLDEAARHFDYSEQSGFSPEVFKRKVRFALTNFYDYEVEVGRDSLGSIACPIFEHTNEVVATVGFLMPSNAIGNPPPKRLVQSLKDCAAKISAALGSTAWRPRSR